jgi:transcriptional regulator with XRE-family HTH domain
MEDPRYKKFITILKQMATTTWHRRTGAMAQEAGISQGHLSRIINGKNIAPYDVQVAIAIACGYEYDNFLQLGQDLLQQKNGSAPTPKHRSIKQTNTEVYKDDAVLMDEDIKMMLRRYDKMVESLEQNNERDRQTHERAMADLRADLERERQERNESKIEIKDLKAENKELMQEYKQLLEQYRALKQKKAQSSQSPDNSKEKKAVNQ